MNSVDTENDPVIITYDENVAVLTMKSRPYNLVDKHLVLSLISALDAVRQRGARAVVLRSGLRHFSAGADLDAMLADTRDRDTLDWHLVDLLEAFEQHPAPIVAAVNGTAVGGGFELALACDLIIASAAAKIGSVEVTVGLHPLMGGVQRLTQRAGATRAKEMALLGRRYDAATLERWNVINRVVADEELDAAAMVIAQELAHGPTLSHAATKQLVNITASKGVEAADHGMAELQRAVFSSEDFVTGVISYRDNGIGHAVFEGR